MDSQMWITEQSALKSSAGQNRFEENGLLVEECKTSAN